MHGNFIFIKYNFIFKLKIKLYAAKHIIYEFIIIYVGSTTNNFYNNYFLIVMLNI